MRVYFDSQTEIKRHIDNSDVFVHSRNDEDSAESLCSVNFSSAWGAPADSGEDFFQKLETVWTNCMYVVDNRVFLLMLSSISESNHNFGD